eukprot:6457395-Amphidinium_carterae.1
MFSEVVVLIRESALLQFQLDSVRLEQSSRVLYIAWGGTQWGVLRPEIEQQRKDLHSRGAEQEAKVATAELELQKAAV